MRILIKRLYVAIALSLILALPLIHPHGAYAAELSGKEKTLVFLTSVILLDIDKYNVTLVSDSVSYPTEYGGSSQEEVRYLLGTNESKLDVTCVFLNNVLSWCMMSVREGVPLYTEIPPQNVIESAKGILERYMYYSSSPRYQEMRDILDAAAKIENTKVAMDNIRLELSIAEEVYVILKWTYVYDNIETPGLQIDFVNGSVYSFLDKGGMFKVGSTTVNVSKEEAIDIATKRAQDFSWTVNGIEIKGFTILKEPVSAELSMQTREPLTLYPFWRVDLCLDKVYPGGVNSIAVGIWADTAEVRYCREMSLGGGPAPQQPSSSGAAVPMEYAYAAALMVGIALATITGYTYLKRKRRLR